MSNENAPFLSSIRTMFSPASPSTLLTDLAPELLRTSILSSIHFPSSSTSTNSTALTPRSSLATIGAGSHHLRGRLGFGGEFGSTPLMGRGKKDSTSVYIIERIDELLGMEIPSAGFDFNADGNSTTGQIPLIRGFNATTSIASTSRLERRKKRAGLMEKSLGLEEGQSLGLKGREAASRGLLGGATEESEKEGLGIGGKKKGGKGKGRKSHLGERAEMSYEELVQEEREVEVDMGNLGVRRAVINSQIGDVESKIAALDSIRDDLRRRLLGLREEELELEDELQGIRESRLIQEERTKGRNVNNNLASSSRRRKGPAFLPSEHDDLPNGVAFMTLHGHLGPITSLDFSEPYGIAVTASSDESVRLWDLTTGEEMGFLKGHDGAVKALQVESNVCITGGVDGSLRIWDLDLAESLFQRNPVPLASPGIPSGPQHFESVLLGKAHPEDVFGMGADSGLLGGGAIRDDGVMREEPGAGRDKEGTPCVKTLDGHTKSVTSLYFDGNCLVTGSSDRTLRQWDLTTGQCVLTMDILWAISNPLASQTLSSDPADNVYPSDPDPYYTSPYSSPSASPIKPLGALRRTSSNYLPGGSTNFSDGSWDRYEDFVGGVQFWGYALASGTGDGCVRMWDMRTGQAHRTLVGHTGPVTCVQFDEVHLVSGSLDKSIRIWDLRTGSISDTIRYENPITALQFDSRKIVAAAGESGVRVFNRTTLQHSTLSINGHTSSMERLRFMDRYLATGGRDCTVKIWALS